MNDVTGLDVDWAIAQLVAFLRLTRPEPIDLGVSQYDPPSPQAQVGPVEDPIEQLGYVVERILDLVLVGWRDQRTSAYDDYRRPAANRALAQLRRQAELDAKLGDAAPSLDAALMHPWVWDGARSLWRSGHFAESVTAASRKVNAEAQNKLGRRDLGETKLFQEAFSTQPPEPGRPRLRLSVDGGSPTFRDRQAGAIQLASGLYTGLRNPASHEDHDELPEHEALEQLAALSVLARMVDRAELATAP